jgi:NAD-dependent dihydropyrimidine dehydrogenase PreA subunit
MPTEDVYDRLRTHLDNLPVGFPKTKSGVEMRILRRLFTEEEAEMAVNLTPFPETLEEIALKIQRDPKEIEPLLETMANKGLIFRNRKGGVTRYRAEWFVVGIYERQVGTITKEFAEDFEQYVDEALRDEIVSTTSTPQLRVVPVAESIDHSIDVAAYDDIRDIIKRQSKIAVAECICKKEKELLGEGCDNPREVCLVFSTGAYAYIENGIGREISQEDALKILDEAEAAGLVCSPSNDQKNFVVCLCCGCCCAILVNLKKLPQPSALIASNYYAQVDSDVCTGCETCIERCQMDAISMDDGIAKIDLDYCIGCGLCVTTCPSDALSLKEKDDKYIPPKNALELYQRIGEERLQARAKKPS